MQIKCIPCKQTAYKWNLSQHCFNSIEHELFIHACIWQRPHCAFYFNFLVQTFCLAFSTSTGDEWFQLFHVCQSSLTSIYMHSLVTTTFKGNLFPLFFFIAVSATISTQTTVSFITIILAGSNANFWDTQISLRYLNNIRKNLLKQVLRDLLNCSGFSSDR